MEETTALAVAERAQMARIEQAAMTKADLVAQKNLVLDVMKSVMVEDQHYGTIPGTKKPSLWKPGAEELCTVFRLQPEFEHIRVAEEPGFIAITVRCTLYGMLSGVKVASAEGSCNSREDKYRYRYIEESTGKPVPGAYWAAKKKGDSKEMKRLLGEGMRAAKINNEWVIAKGIQVENDNPWNLHNTIIKMAEKRALVAATLLATAASDIFTQDLEDFPEFVSGELSPSAKPVAKKAAGKKAKKTSPPADPETGEVAQRTPAGALVGQHQAASALLRELGYKAESTKAFLENLGLPTSMRDFSEHQMHMVLDELRGIKQGLLKEGVDLETLQPPLEPSGEEGAYVLPEEFKELA